MNYIVFVRDEIGENDFKMSFIFDEKRGKFKYTGIKNLIQKILFTPKDGISFMYGYFSTDPTRTIFFIPSRVILHFSVGKNCEREVISIQVLKFFPFGSGRSIMTSISNESENARVVFDYEGCASLKIVKSTSSSFNALTESLRRRNVSEIEKISLNDDSKITISNFNYLTSVTQNLWIFRLLDFTQPHNNSNGNIRSNMIKRCRKLSIHGNYGYFKSDLSKFLSFPKSLFSNLGNCRRLSISNIRFKDAFSVMDFYSNIRKFIPNARSIFLKNLGFGNRKMKSLFSLQHPIKIILHKNRFLEELTIDHYRHDTQFDEKFENNTLQKLHFFEAASSTDDGESAIICYRFFEIALDSCVSLVSFGIEICDPVWTAPSGNANNVLKMNLLDLQKVLKRIGNLPKITELRLHFPKDFYRTFLQKHFPRMRSLRSLSLKMMRILPSFNALFSLSQLTCLVVEQTTHRNPLETDDDDFVDIEDEQIFLEKSHLRQLERNMKNLRTLRIHNLSQPIMYYLKYSSKFRHINILESFKVPEFATNRTIGDLRDRHADYTFVRYVLDSDFIFHNSTDRSGDRLMLDSCNIDSLQSSTSLDSMNAKICKKMENRKKKFLRRLREIEVRRKEKEEKGMSSISPPLEDQTSNRNDIIQDSGNNLTHLEKSKKEWDLQPPYDYSVDWKEYFTARKTFEHEHREKMEKELGKYGEKALARIRSNIERSLFHVELIEGIEKFRKSMRGKRKEEEEEEEETTNTTTKSTGDKLSVDFLMRSVFVECEYSSDFFDLIFTIRTTVYSVQGDGGKYVFECVNSAGGQTIQVGNMIKLFHRNVINTNSFGFREAMVGFQEKKPKMFNYELVETSGINFVRYFLFTSFVRYLLWCPSKEEMDNSEHKSMDYKMIDKMMCARDTVEMIYALVGGNSNVAYSLEDDEETEEIDLLWVLRESTRVYGLDDISILVDSGAPKKFIDCIYQ